MSWLHHTIVVLCIIGSQIGHTHLQHVNKLDAFKAPNKKAAEDFAALFCNGLRKCGIFTEKDIQDYKEISEILTMTFGASPNLNKSPPEVLKSVTNSFAAALAEKAALDINGGDPRYKTKCIVQSLNKAFYFTTGVVNPTFVKEVEKLIKAFYVSGDAPRAPRHSHIPYYGLLGDPSPNNENETAEHPLNTFTPKPNTLSENDAHTLGTGSGAANDDVGEAVPGKAGEPRHLVHNLADAAPGDSYEAGEAYPAPADSAEGGEADAAPEDTEDVGEAVKGKRKKPKRNLGAGVADGVKGVVKTGVGVANKVIQGVFGGGKKKGGGKGGEKGTKTVSGEYITGEFQTGEYTSGQITSGEYTSGQITSGEYTSTNLQTGEYASGGSQAAVTPDYPAYQTGEYYSGDNATYDGYGYSGGSYDYASGESQDAASGDASTAVTKKKRNLFGKIFHKAHKAASGAIHGIFGGGHRKGGKGKDKPTRKPKPLNVIIVPESPGSTPGTVTGKDGRPVKFIVPLGAYTTPGSIPGPDDNPIPVGPEADLTTPGIETGSDGKVVRILLPTTPRPDLTQVIIVPESEGVTPGTVTRSDGLPIKFIVPLGAYTTPGTIPGPDNKPIPVVPIASLTTPGVQTNALGNVVKILLPTTTTTPEPSTVYIPGFDGQQVIIIGAYPGTTTGEITGDDGNPIKFIVPMGAFTTKGDIRGLDNKKIIVQPVPKGSTPGLETKGKGRIVKILLPTTPVRPDLTQVIIVPESPGVTPGTVTNSDGLPIKFIVPYGAYTTPGTIPGPDQEPIPVVPVPSLSTPGVETGPDGNVVKILLPTTKRPDLTQVIVVPETPGVTPGTVTRSDGRPIKFIVPLGAYVTPGSIPGPDRKPIQVVPIDTITTPGIQTNSFGNVVKILLPTTTTTPEPSTALIPGFKGQQVIIIGAYPGTTTGEITGDDGRPIKFIVPMGAFTTKGDIRGPDNKKIIVEPAPKGSTPGLETKSNGKIIKILLPTPPSTDEPEVTTPVTVTTPIDISQIIILPETPGVTPGTVFKNGIPVKIIVPRGAYTTPGSIPGPYGVRIPVVPQFDISTPGFQTGPDGRIILIVVPGTRKSQTEPLPPATVKIPGFNGQQVIIVPAPAGSTTGEVTGEGGRVVKFIVPNGAFSTPGEIRGPNNEVIIVGPAPPGSTPGVVTKRDGTIVKIYLPSTTPGMRKPKIIILTALPGTTPGFVTNDLGRVIKFIVPLGAFSTPGTIPGPDGPIPVGPASPGKPPGAEEGSNGNIIKIFLPSTPNPIRTIHHHHHHHRPNYFPGILAFPPVGVFAFNRTINGPILYPNFNGTFSNLDLKNLTANGIYYPELVNLIGGFPQEDCGCDDDLASELIEENPNIKHVTDLT